ncbi:MAG: hypothetical protein WCD04_09990 [Terriglobia bacterium]|jgi:hypothetical protein
MPNSTSQITNKTQATQTYHEFRSAVQTLKYCPTDLQDAFGGAARPQIDVSRDLTVTSGLVAFSGRRFSADEESPQLSFALG